MTSIDWLIEKLGWNNRSDAINRIVDEAKEMHKQEIIDAWSDGACCGQFTTTPDTPEQYYEETFKQPKQ
jgi:hypothetical protein